MSPSPLASAATSLSSSQIITVTPEAIAELTRLRAEEPDADALGLSLQILSGRGEEFRYDLAFETVTKAAFTDEVRTHRHEDLAIKVIIPAKDLDSLQGATLDFNDRQGLVIRNPNRPLPPVVDGLVSDDELSAEVQGLITAEVNPAGDIPDNQAYVRFSPAGAGFSIRIPEGWSRTTGSHVTTFTDKLNTIRIEPVTGDRLTPAKIRRQEPNRLARTVDGYSPGSTTVVRRPAGDVVRITYTATGSPDVVTGRRTTDAVEEYTFVDRGRGLRLTLSGPKGADNVDPWRIVTDSVRWTR